MYLIPSILLAEKMSAIARSSALLAPKLLKTAPAVGAQTRFTTFLSTVPRHFPRMVDICMSFDNPSILISRNLNLLEYQSKGLLENYGVTVQKFKMAGNADEVKMGVSKINDVHLKSSC